MHTLASARRKVEKVLDARITCREAHLGHPNAPGGQSSGRGIRTAPWRLLCGPSPACAPRRDVKGDHTATGAQQGHALYRVDCVTDCGFGGAPDAPPVGSRLLILVAKLSI